jgi:hypothetical protein
MVKPNVRRKLVQGRKRLALSRVVTIAATTPSLRPRTANAARPSPPLYDLFVVWIFSFDEWGLPFPMAGREDHLS